MAFLEKIPHCSAYLVKCQQKRYIILLRVAVAEHYFWSTWYKTVNRFTEIRIVIFQIPQI